MAIKLYDTQDLVPETQRATAHELKSGKWAVDEPDATPAPLGPSGEAAIAAMKLKVKDAEKAARDSALRVTEMESEAEATRRGITRAELDKIRSDAKTEFAPLVEEVKKLKEERRAANLGDRLKAKMAAAGVMEDRLNEAHAALLFRKTVDLTDDDKDFIVRNENGDVTTELIDAYLTGAYKKAHLWNFKGEDAAGGGGGGSLGGGSPSDAANAAESRAAGKAAADAQKRDVSKSSAFR